MKPKSKKRDDPTNKSIFTRFERRVFLRSITNMEDLLFCRIGFNAGLRISEITALVLDDFILDQGLPPMIHVRKGKGSKERYAHIDDATVQMAFCYYEDLDSSTRLFQMEDRTYERRFKKILERSGITRIDPTPHSMRHTNITMLLNRGMKIEKVMAHAGHTKIEHTVIYVHLAYIDRARRYDEIIGE